MCFRDIMNRLSAIILGIFLFAGVCCANPDTYEPDGNEGPDPVVEAGLPKIYLTGSNADITSSHRAGLLLAGGGTDVDEAMKWLLINADGGDVVVLRASGQDGYNSYLYSSLGVSVNSVRTLVIDSRDKADKDSVERIIRNAEALFIAGGDQSSYLRLWGGTRVAGALRFLLQEKRVTVGGTSAGMAVLSEFVYTGEAGSALSGQSLLNPFDSKVTIQKGFLHIPLLRGIVTDTHFSERDRFGRLVVFMARIAKEHKVLPKAIACDEYSAVCVDGSGMASIYGRSAFFMEAADTSALVCIAASPLSWSASGGSLRFVRVRGNTSGTAKFNLADWSSDPVVWTRLNVVNGVVHEL